MSLHSVVKGKRSEFLIMAQLLENGFNVFQALADIGGIDCGVLGEDGLFYPIQIKSRGEFTKGDLVDITHFRRNMFIIIYDVSTQEYWVIPADEYQRLSRYEEIKDGTSRYRLTMTKKNMSDLERYKGKNGIEVLKNRVSPTS